MHHGIRSFLFALGLVGPCQAFELQLATYFESGDRSRAHGGGITLSLPFDAWAAGPRRVVADPLLDESESSGVEPVSHGAELRGFAQEAAEPKPAKIPDDPAESSAPRGTESEARRVPRLSSGFMRALVDTVLLQYAATGRRLESLDSRARTSAWLPELRLRAGRNTDETVRLTPTLDDPDRWQLTGGADLRLEAQLAWRFNRLVFAGEELGVERLRALGEQRRTRLVETVLDWVFRWQKAALKAEDPALDDQDRLEAVLAMAQAESALDVLSAGWFSRRLPAELARPPSR